MPRKVSTKTRLGNSPYPSLQITWTEDEDQNGWSGEAKIWTDGNTLKPCGNHTVTLRQGMPLGGIYVDVDGSSHGCWSGGSFEGAGLTERDLQWAALYAVEAIKRKEEFLLQF